MCYVWGSSRNSDASARDRLINFCNACFCCIRSKVKTFTEGCIRLHDSPRSSRFSFPLTKWEVHARHARGHWVRMSNFTPTPSALRPLLPQRYMQAETETTAKQAVYTKIIPLQRRLEIDIFLTDGCLCHMNGSAYYPKHCIRTLCLCKMTTKNM